MNTNEFSIPSHSVPRGSSKTKYLATLDNGKLIIKQRHFSNFIGQNMTAENWAKIEPFKIVENYQGTLSAEDVKKVL